MGTVWRIDPKAQEREQITVRTGDIWKDGRVWKIQMPHGIHTTRTKRVAHLWAMAAIAAEVREEAKA